VPYAKDVDGVLSMTDVIDDPVVANPRPVQVREACQLLRPHRSGVDVQEIDLARDARRNVLRQEQ
jgi:hypothetical protein